MIKTALTLVALLSLTAVAEAQSVAWTVDANHTTIGFTARHLGFAKVRGQLKKFTATITADKKTGKIEKLEATAEAKSVDTGVEKRDEDLRSDHFFAADKYPELKLVLRSIKWKGNAFEAVVALTIRDKTKDVKFSGELEGMQKVDFGRGPSLRAAYEAHAKINRKEFGLNFSGLAEGIAIVGDEVELDLELEMSTPAK